MILVASIRQSRVQVQIKFLSLSVFIVCRSTLTSATAQSQLSAAEKQKTTEELLRQVPWFKPKMSR